MDVGSISQIKRPMLSEDVEKSCRKRKVVCDMCKETFSHDNIEVHKVQCSQQVVECDLKCGVRTERCNLPNHMAENCSKLLITCYCCCQEVQKNNMVDHAKKCDWSKCLCDKCGKKVHKEYMDFHQKKRCVKRIIQCVFCDARSVADLLPDHFETCEDVPVHCERKCGKKLPRKKIGEHLQECPRRIIHCKYCEKEVEAQLLGDHHEECVKFPIPCPESCGDDVSRKEVERHLNEECQKRFTACLYKEMQCSYEGYPVEMKRHMKEEVENHFNLAKSVIDKLRYKVESSERKLKSERRVQMQINALLHASFMWKVKDIAKEIVKAQIKGNYSICSLPFYSRNDGYKLRVILFPNGNGSKHKGHLGVSIQVMPGEYDSNLKWPFKKLVTLRLVDQSTQGKDIVHSFRGSDNDYFNIKPKEGKYNAIIHGGDCFVSHEQLNSGSFIVDNVLFLVVSVDE